jgi:hypothetical protein
MKRFALNATMPISAQAAAGNATPDAGFWGTRSQADLKSVTAAALSGMVSLSDSQLAIVTDVARTVPVERRDIFLQRCGAMLKLRGRFSDDDLRQVVELAAFGLVQAADSAA